MDALFQIEGRRRPFPAYSWLKHHFMSRRRKHGRRALKLAPISFTKRNGQKKSCPEIKRPWRASFAQPVMSPRMRFEKSITLLQFGATLNTRLSRPTHSPKFRDAVLWDRLFLFDSDILPLLRKERDRERFRGRSHAERGNKKTRPIQLP